MSQEESFGGGRLFVSAAFLSSSASGFLGRETQRLDAQDERLSQDAHASEDRQLEDLAIFPGVRRVSLMTRTVPS